MAFNLGCAKKTDKSLFSPSNICADNVTRRRGVHVARELRVDGPNLDYIVYMEDECMRICSIYEIRTDR